MAPQDSVKILEVCQVAPACNSPESVTNFSLPLTFLDIAWFKFPPAQQIIFYELTESSPTFFNLVILPRLKKSLSQALFHFLPLAGHLVWPENSQKPILLYTLNDAISLTIAESNADLSHLSGNETRQAIESFPYIPELPTSDTKASVIALQITLFPNKGFSISIVCHHGILDGKSATTFIKAWAYICKHLENDQQPSLPSELTPFLDRGVIKDAHGLEMIFLNQWLALTRSDIKSDSRSLKLVSNMAVSPDVVRATFQLTREDIEILRETISSQLEKVHKEELKPTKQLDYMSTFVLTCAYTVVCMVKARGGDSNRKIYFIFSADCRGRLDPPIPQNYIGNCISSQHIVIKAGVSMEECGVAMIAERISGMIKGLEKGLFEGAKERLLELASIEPGAEIIGVTGSSRFEDYSWDFGWGRPNKVEFTGNARGGVISLARSREGNGGVEIGLALKRHEMENLVSFFVNDLKNFAQISK
ncbi:hypothetical protein D5086_008607 [Populus alba]|uniref:Uncharacterized protein n=1 Tax=Populus alba TaxID=43335 RepID=A0ACC4CHG9_POPAL